VRTGAWLLAAAVAASLAQAAWTSPVPAPPSPDRVYVDTVVDGLVKAGVLTQAQADEIKARATRAAEDAAKAPEPAASMPPPGAKPAAPPAAKPAGWYDRVKIGGYFQGRWQDYPDVASGKVGNEFLVRRARTKLDFQATDRAFAEIEADWAQGKPAVKNAFLDYSLRPSGPWRIRLGQQKVPFGFETPQSTGVMLPFETSWLSQKEFPSGYDAGLVLFYTGTRDRVLFQQAQRTDYGTGDYGNFALALINGQGIVDPFTTGGVTGEANGNKTVVARVDKPFLCAGGRRYAEVGASYFNGRYFSTKAGANFEDDVLGFHAYLPARPWGVQAEYYGGDTEGAPLRGWYTMGLWRPGPRGMLFTRYDSYSGRAKGGGPSLFDRHRISVGYAHQLDDNTRLTAEWDLERDKPGDVKNDLFGAQLMVGY
jgi:hypothetical protein